MFETQEFNLEKKEKDDYKIKLDLEVQKREDRQKLRTQAKTKQLFDFGSRLASKINKKQSESNETPQIFNLNKDFMGKLNKPLKIPNMIVGDKAKHPNHMMDFSFGGKGASVLEVT